MFLYIVRHGETFGNINGDGFAETDLTENGIYQVKRLGERFCETRIDKFYTSPLIRAVKTAESVRKFHKTAPIIADFDLIEHGTAPDYEGLSDCELKKICPDLIIRNRHALGAENAEQAYLRAERIIQKIVSENSFDSHIFVAAHGTFNTFLILAATGLPLTEHFNFSQDNTGVTLIRYLNTDGTLRTKLTYVNDTSHIGTVKY